MSGFESLPAVRWLGLQGPVLLEEDLIYISKSGRRFVFPRGLISDFESRPMLLPGFIHFFLGKSITTALPALGHDYLYHHGPDLDPPMNKSESDALYYEMLQAVGKWKISAWLGWAGLWLGGQKAWDEGRERARMLKENW